LEEFGICDPIILNGASDRKNIIIGGNFRLEVIKDMGYKEVPAVYINIPDIEKEKALNVRLNRNTGSWDWNLLASFDESFLSNIGFTSEELDKVFDLEDMPEKFDIDKELKKLDINNIEIKKGEVWQLGDHKLMCGDSTIEADILKLMDGEKADMCCTDEPYILDYLHGKKRNGKATEGFGLKRDRKYLETDSLPDNFIELWMDNIKKVAKDDFSIISYECWKNMPLMWAEVAKRWKVRNMIIWHLPNRVQGFSSKYKFFNKYDFAMLGSSDGFKLNDEPEEDELLQNEYEAALFATSGKPHWEPYEKGKKYCPTDFIEFKASDAKSSGQGIIFGTKPIEILIPYIKVLTRRGDLIIEPFLGSGSTLIAAEKMGRRCYGMEKSPIYAEVIRKRWENLTNKKAVKISGI
ncbi:MAG: DNA methyltransferase, partial [Minisyncoccales bacterium]